MYMLPWEEAGSYYIFSDFTGLMVSLLQFPSNTWLWLLYHFISCRPFLVNELEQQHLLHDRRKVYEVCIFQSLGIREISYASTHQNYSLPSGLHILISMHYTYQSSNLNSKNYLVHEASKVELALQKGKSIFGWWGGLHYLLSWFSVLVQWKIDQWKVYTINQNKHLIILHRKVRILYSL